MQPLDLVATSFELGIIACGVLLAGHAGGLARRFRGPGLRRFADVGVAVVTGIT